MRFRRLFAALIVVSILPASAAAERVTGEVVSQASRWARGGRAIVTESVLRQDDGTQVTVRQLGGSVDGVGMVLLHGPRLLRVGERAAAEVDLASDLSGRERRVVRAVLGAKTDDGGEVMEFVRTPASDTGAPLAWESSCAFLAYHEDGTTHLDGDLEFDVMHAAVETWAAEIAGCSFFDITEEGRQGGEVGFDSTNLVMFREERWCRPATGDDPEECYDSSAAGLTTLFFIDDDGSNRNGAILDADIELNGVNFAVSDGGESNAPGCKSDLANTFTHELGHLQGLDHTCYTNGARLEDDEGNPQPSCSDDLPPEITEATMYNFQECGETKKTSLSADDIDGVCAIYPSADDPGTCTRPTLDSGKSCGCGAASGTSSWWLVLFALFAASRFSLRGRACSRSRRP